jgi:imidazolonepropionase-like amidohydrolase
MMLLLAAAALASTPTAYVGARAYPVSGPPIDGAVLIVEDGQIRSLGTAAPPEGMAVIDLTGKVIIPGLVDTHSHIGGGRLHENLGPTQPAISAVDAIDPSHVSIQRAQAGGITTANVMPGSGKLMGGQTAYLKLRDVAVVDDMLLCRDPAPPLVADEDLPTRWSICGGMKMANGTNPQGGSGPRSQMGSAYLQRQALQRGVDRLAEYPAVDDGRRRRRREKAPSPPEPDLEADALAQLAAGQRTVHFHTHRADDIITILELQETFGIEVVLHHVSEAWKVAEEIAASGVSCSLIVLDAFGGKEEALEIRAENGAVLERLGVNVAFHTDDPITDSRLFLRSGGMAVRAGMSPEGALRALTLSGAEMMKLDDRIGSLEAGKDADFVVLSGPPLSAWTLVEQTYIDGERVFDRSDPADRAHATGGDAASLTGEER